MALISESKHEILKNFKTKAGNLKTPSHTQAVEWIKSWTNDVSKEMIEKAFLVCGIGSFENIWNSLHGPLKNLLTCENQDTWVEENQNIFLNEKQILIDEDAYFYPIQDTTSPSTSFYKCLHKKKNSQVDFDTWIELSMENMIIKITKVNSHCEVLEELIFGSNDKDEMELVSLDDYIILKLQD
ncbi:hypothetical protein PVAND_011995 [Polypedilum vanderplanki]|uniref:Uncharacterized protein n=1 Tax=Polypedilum vanderplanki TaxID=319348 RepID=A0A9J6CL41_POLVA|nr:hypothetical protein PVAND_011995 [Polypedilum vanderplanki]